MVKENIGRCRPILSRSSIYQFDFDRSKLSGLYFGILIYENLTDIKPNYVTYEKY